MSKQFYSFRKQFLQPQNYQKVKQNSAKLNIKYLQLCNIFQRQFSNLSSNRNNLLKQNNFSQAEGRKRTYKFSSQLKKFISQLVAIIEEQSQYQIQCLSSLKDQNISSFQIIFELLQKVKENKLICSDIEAKTTKLFEKYSQTKTAFTQAHQLLKNPIELYQKQVVAEVSRELKGRITESKRLIEDIKNNKLKAQERIIQFSPYLGAFRKKLINNKYEALQRITKLINNIKYSYLLLADTMKNCAISKKQIFQQISYDENDDISYLKDFWSQIHEAQYLEHYSEQNRKWQKLIYQTSTELQQELVIFETTFLQLLMYFNNICSNFTKEKINLKNLLMQISQIFTENQCPSSLAKSLQNIQDIFVKKIKKLIVGLEDIVSKLRLQRSYYKKNSEMFLTLIKVNQSNARSLSQGIKKQQNQEIIKLIDELTFTNVKRTFIFFYDDSIFLPNQIYQGFQRQMTKRQQSFDSMDISHSYFGYRSNIDKFTPLKQEVWLWRQWKTQVEVNFENYQIFFKEVQQYIEKANNLTSIKQSPILERQKCILIKRKEQVQGELVLKANHLQFVAQSLKLYIKLSQITKVSIKNKFLNDLLVLQTQNGRIKFFKLQKLEYFASSIKEAQQKSLIGKNKKVDKKLQLALSDQELQSIKQRKERIKSQLPHLTSYIKLQEAFFASQRIDQMYQIIYSDNPFSFYGKEEPCFFSYTGKKAGNYNWVAQKYDKPGPAFYTSNKQVNFKNCPVFSTRKVTYNHPMKPSFIPFMPTFCLNTDTRKMYWVSNQELLYSIQSSTQQVPYSDCFLVLIIHKISKAQNGVKIEIFYNIKWLKQTFMKSKIQQSIIPQLTQNMKYFLNQVEKVLRLRGEVERGEAIVPQKQAEEQKQNSVKAPILQDVSKIKLQNRFLIIGFLILLVINVIAYFMLSGDDSDK